MKVYISGAITGIDNYREIFSAAANKLKDRGCTVYNPADIFDGMPEETTYEDYMKLSFCLLDITDAIYMLDNWRESNGAIRELNYALSKCKTVINVDDIKMSINKDKGENHEEN